MSKLAGLQAIFRKISTYGSNTGFHVVPWQMLKTRVTYLVVIEGNLISQRYTDEVFRPVVLPFLC